MNRIITTDSTDPYHNLALEELLFSSHPGGVLMLLWQNRCTVVIGRNQNAWKECRTELLESEGGLLARRTSGGGAVFHDLGNLNFTFITDTDRYDLQKQFAVIAAAVRRHGVHAELSGRNDILASGAKFSGNAFHKAKTASLHHGTLLISANMERLARYLAPSREKLESKGVESVRSRVINLSELSPNITVDSMSAALTEAFTEAYGKSEPLFENELDGGQLAALEQKHASWQWRMGDSPRFDIELSRRFEWGEVQLQLSFRDGLVSQAAAYSDAMDEALIGALAPALTDVRFTRADMAARVRALGAPEADDIALWIEESGI